MGWETPSAGFRPARHTDNRTDVDGPTQPACAMVCGMCGGARLLMTGATTTCSCSVGKHAGDRRATSDTRSAPWTCS